MKKSRKNVTHGHTHTHTQFSTNPKITEMLGLTDDSEYISKDLQEKIEITNKQIK